MKKVTKETHLQLLLIALLLSAVILMLQNPFNKKSKVPATQTQQVLQHYVPKPMTDEGKSLKAKLVKTEKYYGDLQISDDAEFNVTYNISNDNFWVIIKKEPYQAIKAKAEAWFMTKGFKDFDLCVLNIKFVAGDGITSNLTSGDTVFDRCPVPDADQATPSASPIAK